MMLRMMVQMLAQLFDLFLRWLLEAATIVEVIPKPTPKVEVEVEAGPSIEEDI